MEMNVGGGKTFKRTGISQFITSHAVQTAKRDGVHRGKCPIVYDVKTPVENSNVDDTFKVPTTPVLDNVKLSIIYTPTT